MCLDDIFPDDGGNKRRISVAIIFAEFRLKNLVLAVVLSNTVSYKIVLYNRLQRKHFVIRCLRLFAIR
jgi:hypothetical protein